MGKQPSATPFWREKPLEAMTDAEWESLCDGCGRCCLNKVIDADTDEVHYTNIRCRLLDANTCRCTNYPQRRQHVPTCEKITPEAARNYAWLPPSCAYRRLAEGRGLAWWHPLVSGDPQTVIDAGVSVYGRTVGDDNSHNVERMSNRALNRHVVDWPLTEPPEEKD